MSQLKRSSYVELKTPIHCIPAGIYKVLGMSEDSIELIIGEKIVFGIMGDLSKIIHPVSEVRGKKEKKRQLDFIHEYTQRMRTTEQVTVDKELPQTYCAIDSSLAHLINHVH